MKKVSNLSAKPDKFLIWLLLVWSFRLYHLVMSQELILPVLSLKDRNKLFLAQVHTLVPAQTGMKFEVITLTFVFTLVMLDIKEYDIVHAVVIFVLSTHHSNVLIINWDNYGSRSRQQLNFQWRNNFPQILLNNILTDCADGSSNLLK